MAGAHVRADTIAGQPERGRVARRAAAVAFFATLTAAAGAIAVPVPLSPVPVTMQTLVVLLSGALLGRSLGASAQALYLAVGALGAPVFAFGAGGVAHLFGPTGGYLLAFPVAAAVVGALAPRADAVRSARGLARLGFALVCGTIVVYAGGIAQLQLFVGSIENAVQHGLLPFLAGDAVKLGLGLIIAHRLRNRTLGLL